MSLSKKKMITFTLPVEEYTELLAKAEKENKSRNIVAKEMLIEALKEESNERRVLKEFASLRKLMYRMIHLTAGSGVANLKAHKDKLTDPEALTYEVSFQKYLEHYKVE